jgi:hypothetical protein
VVARAIGAGTGLKLLHLHEVSGALVATLQDEKNKTRLVVDVWQSLDGENWQLRLRILPGAVSHTHR